MRVCEFNGAFCELFGKSPEAVHGRFLTELLPGFPVLELQAAAAQGRNFRLVEFQPLGTDRVVVEVIGVSFESSAARFFNSISGIFPNVKKTRLHCGNSLDDSVACKMRSDAELPENSTIPQHKTSLHSK